jgi:glycosyltransferase involved in cell wall biosynthesis
LPYAEKNLALLERTASAIGSARPGTRLVVVGDGPCEASMQGRWPGAVFAGRQRAEALATHYASGDLLLFPSLTETFGNATLEAMASGLGVVAFRYGAAAEVIKDGCSGWLAPRGDADAFVGAAVGAALKPSLLARVRVAAAARSQGLGWARVIGDLVEVYRRSIREGIPSTRHAAEQWQWGHI